MSALNKIAITLGVLGSLPIYLLFGLLFYFFMSGWFFLPFGLMVIIATILVSVIKVLVKAKRPKKYLKGKPKYFWQHIDQYSMPSGHTALASGFFFITLFNMDLYNKMLLVTILAGVFLVVVAYSRVYLKKHFWRDIAVGILVGLASAVLASYISPLIDHWFSVGSFIVLTHTAPAI